MFQAQNVHKFSYKFQPCISHDIHQIYKTLQLRTDEIKMYGSDIKWVTCGDTNIDDECGSDTSIGDMVPVKCVCGNITKTLVQLLT